MAAMTSSANAPLTDAFGVGVRIINSEVDISRQW